MVYPAAIPLAMIGVRELLPDGDGPTEAALAGATPPTEVAHGLR